MTDLNLFMALFFPPKQEKDKKYMLALDNLHLRDMADTGFIKQKKSFALLNSEQRWETGFLFNP